MTDALPVVVGVGQVTHRDDDDPAPAEPIELLLAAARAAETDAGARLLDRVDGIELMPIGAWPYDDLPRLVVERLGLDASRVRAREHPIGGETPIRALDAAAARIAAGDARVVLLAGAEGTRAVTRARRAGVELPWTPPGARPTIPTMAPVLQRAAAVGIGRAIHCFPLYEHALRAHEGVTLDEAQAESGALWSGLSAVAADNPYAWSRTARSAADVLHVGPDNRMITFPYPKSLTANPFVNQGAALLVTDADTARALGIPETRWVHPLGGAGADEPTDPRVRVAYHHVPALDVTVRDVQEITATTTDDYDVVELYSCFPAMPKLTRRALGRERVRIDLGHRWALVRRWPRQQLPHPLAGGHGRAPPRRRWDGLRPRRRDVQHQAPRHRARRPPAGRRRVPRAEARCRRAPAAGDRAGRARRGLHRPGDGAHVHGRVRPGGCARSRVR